MVKESARPSRTERSMSLDPARSPRGTPETIRKRENEISKTSKMRQNEAALVLSRAGYDVEQRPAMTSADLMRNPWLNPAKKPDYKIEGEIFDCITPQAGTPAQNIAGRIRVEKVAAGQARRIVLNMSESNVPLDELREHVTKRLIPNLQEIIIVKIDEAVLFYPAK